MASPLDISRLLPQVAVPGAQLQPHGQTANQLEGYDCKFVQQPPDIIQSNCPICHLVLREPYQAPCCGNSFCRTCIEPLRLANADCPTCRHAGFTTFPDKRLERSLNPLKVYCSRRDDGCEWSGELSALCKHLNENAILSERLAGCQFVDVTCMHCAQPFRRHSLNNHQLSECLQRPYSCDYCGDYESTFEGVVKKHYPECVSYPLPCPNKCDELPEGYKYMIERQHVERHVKEECILTVVECDFEYAGCEARLPRKDMASHLDKNLLAHMSLTADHSKKAATEAAEAQRTATEAQRTAAEAHQALIQRDKQIAQLVMENKSLKCKLEKLELHSHLHTPPVTFTMTNFVQHKRNEDTWYSPPFYSHPHGHKLCVRVICKAGDTFDVSVVLMRGEFDNHLQWPFQSDVYIRILNQLADADHISITAPFSGRPDDDNMQVTEGERHLGGFGDDIFYALLDRQADCTKSYLKDDTIQLQLFRIVDPTLSMRLERQILSATGHKSVCTPPCQFIMTDFEQHKKDGECWYSPSFYTHPKGYRMCLQIDTSGYDIGKGTHISLYTMLMRGEFDSQLKWPFRGKITIQLMSQLEDKKHRTCTISYIDATSDSVADQVTVGELAVGRGLPQFILHSELGLNKAKKCQYLKDNKLIFCISKVE